MTTKDEKIGPNLYRQPDGRTYSLMGVAINPVTHKKFPLTADTRERGWPIRNMKTYLDGRSPAPPVSPELQRLLPEEQTTTPPPVEPDVLEPETSGDPILPEAPLEPGAPTIESVAEGLMGAPAPDGAEIIEPNQQITLEPYDLKGELPLSKMNLGAMTHEELDQLIAKRNLGKPGAQMTKEAKAAWMQAQEAERLAW